MSENFETKIDDIAKNVSYMRGKYDEAIPAIQKMLATHDEKIGKITVTQENFKGKVAVAGGIAGLGVSAIFAWIGKHLF